MTTRQQSNNWFYAIAFCFSIFAVASIWALRTTQTLAPPPPPTHSTMTEQEKLKQSIREKEAYRDSCTDAANAAAGKRNFEESSEWARKAAEAQNEINILWDKVHEANLKEGENNDEKK